MLNGKFVNVYGESTDGKEVSFSIKCEKCGGDAYLITSQHFKQGPYINPAKITMSIRCDCGNNFTAHVAGQFERKEYNVK